MRAFARSALAGFDSSLRKACATSSRSRTAGRDFRGASSSRSARVRVPAPTRRELRRATRHQGANQKVDRQPAESPPAAGVI
jgi:hypothetical protein